MLSAIQRARQVLEDLGMKRANLHLFLACPLAMAVLVGQKLNTFSACHLLRTRPRGNSVVYQDSHVPPVQSLPRSSKLTDLRALWVEGSA